MTRSIVEARGPRVKGPSTHDAHCWLRNDDRQPIRSGGRIEYGNNRVQEIVSGTLQRYRPIQVNMVPYYHDWFPDRRHLAHTSLCKVEHSLIIRG